MLPILTKAIPLDLPSSFKSILTKLTSPYFPNRSVSAFSSADQGRFPTNSSVSTPSCSSAWALEAALVVEVFLEAGLELAFLLGFSSSESSESESTTFLAGALAAALAGAAFLAAGASLSESSSLESAFLAGAFFWTGAAFFRSVEAFLLSPTAAFPLGLVSSEESESES